jgi:hypothetical protein
LHEPITPDHDSGELTVRQHRSTVGATDGVPGCDVETQDPPVNVHQLGSHLELLMNRAPPQVFKVHPGADGCLLRIERSCHRRTRSRLGPGEQSRCGEHLEISTANRQRGVCWSHPAG